MKLSRANLKRLLELAKFDRPQKETKAMRYIRQLDLELGIEPPEETHKSDRPFKLTSAAISFLIHVARLQDEHGNVYALHRKEIASAIGCHSEYFYPLLNSLEYYGFIEIINDEGYKNSPEGYWDIKILDNDFSTEADYKKGYLNVNLEILQSKEFHQMPCSDKIVLLHILMNMHLFVGGNLMTIHYIAIENWTGVGRQTIKQIIKRLSKILKIVYIDKLTIAVYPYFGDGKSLSNRATDKTGQTENEVKNTHFIRFILRIIGSDPDNPKHTNLISHIAKICKAGGKKIIKELFQTVTKALGGSSRISSRKLAYIYSCTT